MDDVARLTSSSLLGKQVSPPRLQAVGITGDLLLKLDILFVL